MTGSNMGLATWPLVIVSAYGIRQSQTPCILFWDERVKEIKLTRRRMGVSRARAYAGLVQASSVGLKFMIRIPGD